MGEGKELEKMIDEEVKDKDKAEEKIDSISINIERMNFQIKMEEEKIDVIKARERDCLREIEQVYMRIEEKKIEYEKNEQKIAEKKKKRSFMDFFRARRHSKK